MKFQDFWQTRDPQCLKLGAECDFAPRILPITLFHRVNSAFHFCLVESILNQSREGRPPGFLVLSLTPLLVGMITPSVPVL